MQTSPISSESILEQLQKIVSSSLFENAARSRTLLTFVVERAVDNQADRLKEYTLGAEALGRGDSFDPRTDPIVRAEASRLRSRLERYYAADGRTDPRDDRTHRRPPGRPPRIRRKARRSVEDAVRQQFSLSSFRCCADPTRRARKPVQL